MSSVRDRSGSVAPRAVPPTGVALVLAFSGIMLATLMAALDQTIVATALPAIADDLHDFEHLSGVITVYLVASTVTVPLYGRLSDVHGRRALFVVAIVVFLAGSVLCGLSSSMTQLTAARAVHGIGAGGLIPLSQIAVADLFSPRERGRYQGFVGGVWALAAVAGPLVGGSLTDSISWRWIFFINIPVGALALVALVRTMPAGTQRREHRLDLAGAALLTASVTCLLLAAAWGGVTHPWGSPPVAGTAAAGAVLLAAFVLVERRIDEPLVPLSLFGDRTFRVSAIAGLFIGAVLFGVTVDVPLFVQGVLGAPAIGSGLVLMPLALGWVATSFAAGHAIARTGRYRWCPIAGGVLILAGVVLLARIDASTSRVVVGADVVLVGVGMGMSFQTYLVATQNAVAGHQLGIATASLQFFRTIGAGLAVAGLGAVLNNRVGAELAHRLGPDAGAIDRRRLLDGGADVPAHLQAAVHAALSASLATVYAVLIPFAVVGVLLALRLPEQPLRGTVG